MPLFSSRTLLIALPLHCYAYLKQLRFMIKDDYSYSKGSDIIKPFHGE